MRPRHIHSDDRNMVKKTTRKRWMVIRCRSSSTQNFSQQTCCINTICCHVPSMIDWIFISKRRDSLSFVAFESTQSQLPVPCEPKPQNGWVLYQPCQRSHSTPWLTYMAQLLPPRLAGFISRMLCRLMSLLSLSDSKKLVLHLKAGPCTVSHAGKNGWSMFTTSLLNTLKKCLKSAICIKTSFDSNPGKILRLATRLQHACTESCQALRAAKSHFLGAQDSARKIPRRARAVSI